MKTLAAQYILRKNQLSASADRPWIWLAEIYRDDTTILRYAKARENITYNGNTYVKRAMNLQPPEIDADGSTKNWTLEVSNIDRLMATYLEAGEIIKYPVKIIFVHGNLLTVTTNEDAIDALVVNADYNNRWAVLHCGSYDLRSVKAPGKVWTRTRCWYEFKGLDGRCGYAGGETVCNKTYARCTALANQARFGAARAMPVPRP